LARDGKVGELVVRIGTGFDVHRFSEGRKLILGGIEIESERGLLGHSDADVILHAIMDAMLGALALGDIGQHFPDTDETYKGADSQVLARHVWKLICEHGYQLGNIDVMVLAEVPKLAPHLPRMRAQIAELFDSELNQISIKATTMEKMGFVGREEGMAAQATVLLVKQTIQ
jgi:2-C-methyl-D-erythritol 2,4-cyclodiphosphate synthase